MKKTIWKVLLLTCCLVFIFPVGSSGDDGSYSYLEDLGDEVFFFGDQIEVDSGVCWPSSRPFGAVAKKRLEVFNGTKWSSVGKVKFPKSSSCTKKNPYMQTFVWEVDRFGMMNNDGISGKARLRNSAIKPSTYSQIIVFESEASYNAKIQAEQKAAEEKKRRDEYIAMKQFECLILGGEWNSQGEYCVYTKP